MPPSSLGRHRLLGGGCAKLSSLPAASRRRAALMPLHGTPPPPPLPPPPPPDAAPRLETLPPLAPPPALLEALLPSRLRAASDVGLLSSAALPPGVATSGCAIARVAPGSTSGRLPLLLVAGLPAAVLLPADTSCRSNSAAGSRQPPELLQTPAASLLASAVPADALLAGDQCADGEPMLLAASRGLPSSNSACSGDASAFQTPCGLSGRPGCGGRKAGLLATMPAAALPPPLQ